MGCFGKKASNKVAPAGGEENKERGSSAPAGLHSLETERHWDKAVPRALSDDNLGKQGTEPVRRGSGLREWAGSLRPQGQWWACQAVCARVPVRACACRAWLCVPAFVVLGLLKSRVPLSAHSPSLPAVHPPEAEAHQAAGPRCQSRASRAAAPAEPGACLCGCVERGACV